jgi:hypothetical protein
MTIPFWEQSLFPARIPHVRGIPEPSDEPAPTLTIVVEKSDTKEGWRIANFIYDSSGWNLADYLRLMHARGAVTQQKNMNVTGELSADQIKWLKAEKLRCVVPTYIPAGMHLWKFALGPRGADQPATVELTYRGVGKAEFTVQMASDGIGDLILQSDDDEIHEATRLKRIRNRDIGDVELEFLPFRGEDHFGFNWVPLGKTYPLFALVVGDHIGFTEAVKIVRGVRFLK